MCVLGQWSCRGDVSWKPKRSKRAEFVVLVTGSANPANWLGDWVGSSRVDMMVSGGRTGCGWGGGGGMYTLV